VPAAATDECDVRSRLKATLTSENHIPRLAGIGRTAAPLPPQGPGINKSPTCYYLFIMLSQQTELMINGRELNGHLRIRKDVTVNNRDDTTPRRKNAKLEKKTQY
jgi:hypothetical protein